MCYNILFFTLFLATFGCCSPIQSPEHQNERLSFKTPARIWEETLPLGNGRLGMMPDGGVKTERIVLNEISLWSGSEADYSNPEAANSLPRIQQLLFEGKNKEAQELMYRTFVPRMPDGNTYGTYQILGNLDIRYNYAEPTDTTGYRRTLQLDEAVAITSWEKNQREYFVSRPDDIMIIHFKQPQISSFELFLNRPQHARIYRDKDTLIMEGSMDSGQPGTEGVKYIVKMAGRIEKNSPKGTIEITDSCLRFNAVSDATIFISATTDYSNPVYREQASALLSKAIGTSYDELKQRHIGAHRELYNRVQIFTGTPNDSVLQLTTPERVARFTQKDDPALAALYLQFGRYLLISSARPGCLPPNLQGVWANTLQTPWNGDYHTNINVQMNHWPLEPGNLTELYEPLITLTKGLVISGEKTARTFYGPNARGWVAHMMTNPWKYTVPGEHPSWGATNTGGAWLCAHLWEHFLYSGDSAYLQEIYPVMKGAADFFLSTMVKEPKNGWLVTAPTSSPENAFYIGDDPTPISICMGPTMDIQLVKELWENTMDAAQRLGIDSAWCTELAEAYKQLPPHQISQEGYLMEWLEDYKEAEIHHRHVSHLYGLYPGNLITPLATPELAEACKVTLNRRGDGGTGWSRAWKINFWARLHDGNRAYKLFHSLLVPAVREDGRHQGGTFPNLFCSHPPFQIDGNFGGASGVMEMLLQSHAGFIHLLPALPDSWKEGHYKGLCARGGIMVDLKWSDNKPRTATFTSRSNTICRLLLPAGISGVSVNKQIIETDNDPYLTFSLRKGEKAEVKFTY